MGTQAGGQTQTASSAVSRLERPASCTGVVSASGAGEKRAHLRSIQKAKWAGRGEGGRAGNGAAGHSQEAPRCLA